jgi:DNA-binding NtrC family response regulator
MELLKDGVSGYTPKSMDNDELKQVVSGALANGTGSSPDGHSASTPAETAQAPAGAANPLFADAPSLEEVKRRYIRHVIVSTNGNLSRAASILDVDRRSLYRMIARLEIQVPGRD